MQLRHQQEMMRIQVGAASKSDQLDKELQAKSQMATNALHLQAIQTQLADDNEQKALALKASTANASQGLAHVGMILDHVAKTQPPAGGDIRPGGEPEA